MKKPCILSFFIFCSITGFSQKNWFQTYADSASLVADAGIITQQFVNDIKKIDPAISFNPKTVLHTTPYLIYFAEGIANISLWEQVIPELKAFMYKFTGSEEAGKKMFGYFFNGFYLPHELGHGLTDAVKKAGLTGSYTNEYSANIIAMLWWRKHGREKDLEQCYEFTKKVFSQLPDPVPAGKTVEQYFTENYEEATQNPAVYGYMQFGQYIKIYEDKTLPDFDTFIKAYIAEK